MSTRTLKSAPAGLRFGLELFRFLEELKAHNDRAWFEANRPRYEAEARGPMLAFIERLSERLPEVSPHFVADARPVGGSMFRIHRDTRFSKDKTPYKTSLAAHFRHRTADNPHTPGFYLRLEPGGSLGGGGIWRPDSVALGKIRDRIVSEPEEWGAVLASGIALEGDALKRPPAGYDREHPFVEDLKRKDFVTTTPFSEDEVCAQDFLERYLESCRKTAPLVAFLTRALELPY